MVLPEKVVHTNSRHLQATRPDLGKAQKAAFPEARFIRSTSGIYIPFMQPLQVQIDAFVQENAVSH